VEPEPRRGVEPRVRKLNPTLVALLAGVVILLGLIAFFAIGRDPDQDKLSDTQITQNAEQPAGPEKRCASKATYDLIKRELFRQGAQARGSDQAVYASIAAQAVARMENAVLESEDSASGALNCSGSLSIDLPPGVEVAGGRRSLSANVDYTIDASGNVSVGSAEAIVAPLATLARVEQQVIAPPETNELAPEANIAASESATAPVGPATSYPGRPSFDCARAQARGEIAVCSDSGLSALDVNMTREYRRALAAAPPAQAELLRGTARRFYIYRDRCPNRQCIADAYVGRMREIRDIVEGRWSPR
jgi:hypothetical protein